MHCIVPFAAPQSEALRAAAQGLELPGLAAFLAAADPPGEEIEAPDSFTMPHERVQGIAWGLRGDDGRWPLAAGQMLLAGLQPGPRPWARMVPVHWALMRDRLVVHDPQALDLRPDEAKALLDAVRPLFEGDAWSLVADPAGDWFVGHPMLAGARLASLDRVIGRPIESWFGDDPVLRPLRRLQAEVQMLWSRHPVNDARAERGALPVNSFWLCDGGAWPPQLPRPRREAAALHAVLRSAALADDGEAWAAAWRDLDATVLQPWVEVLLRTPAVEAGATAAAESLSLPPLLLEDRLTLCGEQGARSWRWRGPLPAVQAPPPGLWQRWKARFAGGSPAPTAQTPPAGLLAWTAGL